MIDLKKRYEVFLSGSKLTLSSVYALLAPVLLWFAYQPGVTLGVSAGMHLKISLPLVYLAGFVVIFANEPKGKGTFVGDLLREKSALYLCTPFLYATYALLSLVWAANRARGAVEVAVLVALMCAYVVYLTMCKQEAFFAQMVKLTTLVTAVMSVLAIGQTFWGSFSDLGLCRGCLASGFGFARPSLFALEPQFLGSLLLAPVLLLFYKLVRNKCARWEMLTLLLACIVLFLTLSRGAIYAALGGGFVMILIFIGQKVRAGAGRAQRAHSEKRAQNNAASAPNKRAQIAPAQQSDKRDECSDKHAEQTGSLTKIAMGIGIVVLAFIISLAIDTAALALNSRVDESPLHAPEKIISQLSMGKIELGAKRQATQSEAPPASQSEDAAAFDGYVQLSTNERNYSTAAALQVYRSSLPVMLFGVGAGSSGAAMTRAGLVGNFEIVQNQYVSVLLELGIVGLVLFLGIFVLLGVMLARRRDTAPLLGILVAFALQWYFFSGFPNALHVYLSLALLASFALGKPLSAPRSRRL